EAEIRELAGDHHHALGRRIGERLQQHAVDDAEDSRVGADPERKREDGDDRVAGAPGQRAKRVSQVLLQRLHGRLIPRNSFDTQRLDVDAPANGCYNCGRTNGPYRPRRHGAPGAARDPAPRARGLRHPDPRRSIDPQRTRRLARHGLCRAQAARAEGPGHLAARRQHPRARRTRQTVLQAAPGRPESAQGLTRDVPRSVARLRVDPRPRVTAMHSLPRLALTLSRLIPAADREAIVGDLLEDAECRDLTGARLELWLCAELGTIAAGLTVECVRAGCTLPPIREMAAGLVLDGARALRGVRDSPWTALARVAVFCASVATLAAAAEVLVAALFNASGLRNP